MQRSSFTLKAVCSYILYRAKEEGRTASKGVYESNQLAGRHVPKLCVDKPMRVKKAVIEVEM